MARPVNSTALLLEPAGRHRREGLRVCVGWRLMLRRFVDHADHASPGTTVACTGIAAAAAGLARARGQCSIQPAVKPGGRLSPIRQPGRDRTCPLGEREA